MELLAMSDKIAMINKYKFELALERVAEKFYFHGATQYGKKRGGNSADNEAYFRNVATDLRSHMGCQQIMLKSGACPDSGVFGDYGYKNDEDVSWELVENGTIVAIEVEGVSRQKRFIEVRVDEIGELPLPLKKDSKVILHLNKLNGYGEFFGVEYKASKSKSKKSISVASFNSTCPSGTKTISLNKIKMYHNLESASKATKIHDYSLKSCEIKLVISFSIYYLIVNDYPIGEISEIKKIFVCDGGFFAPDMSEEDADRLSTELDPNNLKIEYSLYRVRLRYRPFFDSSTIRANGYGLYTSWEPKIPGAEEEERQRELLLKEVEKVQQTFTQAAGDESEENEGEDGQDQLEPVAAEVNPDNVIYLTLREDRIKKRAA